jgi:hypothetical protein
MASLDYLGLHQGDFLARAITTASVRGNHRLIAVRKPLARRNRLERRADAFAGMAVAYADRYEAALATFHWRALLSAILGGAYLARLSLTVNFMSPRAHRIGNRIVHLRRSV